MSKKQEKINIHAILTQFKHLQVVQISISTNFYSIYHSLQTLLYTEDWIGLKTLDEAGKVKFINVSGNHLQISQGDMKEYIVPYLEDEASKHVMRTETSSSKWLSSIWNFLLELVGFTEDIPLLCTVDWFWMRSSHVYCFHFFFVVGKKGREGRRQSTMKWQNL